MARLLTESDESTLDAPFGARELCVEGEVYGNSAAKFWSSLVDEVVSEFPGSDTVVLKTSVATQLRPSLLYPENALQRDFDDLANTNLEEVIRETTAELELMGQPARVVVSLMSGGKQTHQQILKREFVDADVYVYLLSWLLKWAEVPSEHWNDTSLDTSLLASDLGRDISYEFDLSVLNTHLSEGLYERKVVLAFQRNVGQ
jgi:hypothetical protein